MKPKPNNPTHLRPTQFPHIASIKTKKITTLLNTIQNNTKQHTIIFSLACRIRNKNRFTRCMSMFLPK